MSANRAAPTITRLERDWSYRPSGVAARTRIKRLVSVVAGRRRPPSWRMVLAPQPSDRWNLLFLYAPSGSLDSDQRQILDRARHRRGSLMVVVAAMEDDVPDEVRRADALIVKGLSGYDLSGYRIGLEAIARSSPGATVLVQNDSVLGPFGDIDAFVADARWDFTGVIGARAVENHVSTFAFVLKGVTPARIDALRPVLSPSWACDRFDDVILLQETRLARIAARTMSVGASWYVSSVPMPQPLFNRIVTRLGGRSDGVLDPGGDATLACPIALLDDGFPFLKRSLFTKFAGLHDTGLLRDRLAAEGWR